MEEESPVTAFLRTVNAGDVLSGTVAEITRSGAAVLLDAFDGGPVGVIGPLDLSWSSFGRSAADLLDVGARAAACRARSRPSNASASSSAWRTASRA
ncbi:hypothetical protein [Nonomuraea sp. WAC 01424]|uniref:hypothetical protein n=1 Tax=Nonomuraea sp. WAC 01424 TaxID=2203200 RepID=UPI0021ADA544|nr:hypothetical protein [Nonomuraea sp. WAC 01424]